MVVLAWPLMVVATLLLGLATGLVQLAAIVVLVGTTLLALAALIGVRRWRRRRAASAGDYAFAGALEGLAPGVAAETAVDDAAGGRLRAEEVLAGIPAGGLTAFALSTGAPTALSALARAATRHRFDLASLVAAVSVPSGERLIGPTDVRMLAALVRATTSRASAPEPSAGWSGAQLTDAATALSRAVARHPERRALSADEHRAVAAQLLMGGERELAGQLLAERSSAAVPDWLLALDAIDRGEPSGDDAWLALFNAFYRRAGLESVTIDARASTLFDGLSAVPHSTVRDGPLVSVIMTVYRPGDDALSAVKSVIGQSWQRWELVVIDDASGPAYDGMLAQIASLDDRVRVVRAERNEGTYVRRNDALSLAAGEFVTMHDSDDWAHPRRLEAQVRHLQRNPDELANLVRSLRATPELRFAQPRGATLRLTEASIMLRRERVSALVGRFDDVRKAADTGFRLRLEAATGRPVPIVEPEVPLMIVRFDPASLSGAELGDGWMSPARMAYISAHAHWLATAARAGRPLSIHDEEQLRPFPAPAALRGEQPAPADVDAILVLDVRDDPERRRVDARIDAVIAQVAQDRRLAVLRGERPASRALPHTARSALQELISSGRVIEVLPGDPVRARALVVPDELALLGLSLEVRETIAQHAVLLGPESATDPAAALRGGAHVRSRVAALVEGEVRSAPHADLSTVLRAGRVLDTGPA